MCANLGIGATSGAISMTQHNLSPNCQWLSCIVGNVSDRFWKWRSKQGAFFFFCQKMNAVLNQWSTPLIYNNNNNLTSVGQISIYNWNISFKKFHPISWTRASLNLFLEVREWKKQWVYVYLTVRNFLRLLGFLVVLSHGLKVNICTVCVGSVIDYLLQDAGKESALME